MTREPDPIGFDDIVASWQREGGVPQWPDDNRWPAGEPAPPDARASADDRAPTDDAPTDDANPAADGHHERFSADDLARGDAGASPLDRVPGDDHLPGDGTGSPGRPTGPAADPLADEHFVPPEPPPLPRLGPPILVGLTLIGLGLVLVTFPGWVGVPQVYGLPLGLVAVAAGLGWLVLRLWPDSSDGSPPPLYLDDPDDPDGGAVL